jgi:hypothetical protein
LNTLTITINGIDLSFVRTDDELNICSYIVKNDNLYLIDSLQPMKAVCLNTGISAEVEGDYIHVFPHSVVFEGETYNVCEEKEILPYDLVLSEKLELYDAAPTTVDTDLICEYVISKNSRRPKYVGNFSRVFVLRHACGKKVVHKREIENILEDLTIIINYCNKSELTVQELHKLKLVRAEVANLKEEIMSLKSK